MDVEVVVGHIQPVHSIMRRQIGGPLHSTGEGAVGRREGGLPQLGELIHEPRNFSLVGLIVQEDDGPLARENHARKSGPIVKSHRDLGRGVDEIFQARILDGSREVSGVDIIAIPN